MDTQTNFTIFITILFVMAIISACQIIGLVSQIMGWLLVGCLGIIVASQLNTMFRYRKPRGEMYGP